jgi:hypothetical protein
MISESGFLRRFKEHFLPELYFDDDQVIENLKGAKTSSNFDMQQ